MRKQGPCLHCGVARTPLWRNGPPEKPVLCNACGSRYRIGKSLENYTPRTYHVVKHKKRKQAASKAIVNYEDNNARYSPTLEGYYASSESSTTYANYHNHHFLVKQENLDEIPVENWGSFWEAPARKRSQVVYNNLTTIQKLRIDLHNILRNENPLNNASEDVVLIYNVDVNKMRTSSTEIGHGTILLKVPDDASQEQQQQQQQIIGPCSPSVCGKVSPLNQGQTASPSLANAGSSEDIHSVQNEISPKVSEEGDDHGASPTTTKEAAIAADYA